MSEQHRFRVGIFSECVCIIHLHQCHSYHKSIFYFERAPAFREELVCKDFNFAQGRAPGAQVMVTEILHLCILCWYYGTLVVSRPNWPIRSNMAVVL